MFVGFEFASLADLKMAVEIHEKYRAEFEKKKNSVDFNLKGKDSEKFNPESLNV